MRAPRATTLIALAAFAVFAASAAAYTVILKDGSRIVAREEIQIEGETAIIVLQNGTRTSIDAAEIDLERTREANRVDYGSAVVVDEGQVQELPATAAPPPRRGTLSDVLARRQTRAESPGRGPAAPAPGRAIPPPVFGDPQSDYRMVPRRPFGDLEVAAEVQRTLRAQGVEEVLLFQGTRPGHLLLDITANSEASVFRALETAADTLLMVRDRFPGKIDALELLMATAERDPAGQFLIDVESARRLAQDEVEVSAFFVDHVRF